MRLADASRSRLVLIGTAEYDDPDLPALSAVTDNLTDLADVLTSSWAVGPMGDRCVIVRDPDDLGTVGEELENAADRAEDLLLVYFAGHGLVDATGQLYLALRSTRSGRLRWSGLPISHVRECLAGARARNRVLILDCCFSGRAIEAMGDPLSMVSAQLDIAGTYTLTSTSATRPSHAPTGARHTAFTGALLHVLRSGVPDAPELLTLRTVYDQLLRILPAEGKPRPEQRGTLTADQLALARNRAIGSAIPNNTAAGDRPVHFVKQPLLAKKVKIEKFLAFTIPVVTMVAIYLAWFHTELKLAVISIASLGALITGFLISSAWARRPYLTVTESGLTFGDHKGRSADIEWHDILFVGLLHELKSYVPHASTITGYSTESATVTYTDVIIVRLRENVPESVREQWNRVAVVADLHQLGYLGLCELDKLAADPVLLRQSVIGFAGPIYHTNQELLDLDPRLRKRLGP